MEEGLACRLVQVGIRAMTPHQRDQAGRFGVESIDMRAWAAGARPGSMVPSTCRSTWTDSTRPSRPASRTGSPGGLSTREVIGMIHALTTPIVGADVVEFNPRRDAFGLTATVAAKLVKELRGADGGRR